MAWVKFPLTIALYLALWALLQQISNWYSNLSQSNILLYCSRSLRKNDPSRCRSQSRMFINWIDIRSCIMVWVFSVCCCRFGSHSQLYVSQCLLCLLLSFFRLHMNNSRVLSPRLIQWKQWIHTLKHMLLYCNFHSKSNYNLLNECNVYFFF